MMRLHRRLVFAGLALASAAAISAAEFPRPHDSETDSSRPRMPAAEAAARMTVPPGCQAMVFAAEPDVQNPIAMAWDARGRLWVAENYTYAEHARALRSQPARSHPRSSKTRTAMAVSTRGRFSRTTCNDSRASKSASAASGRSRCRSWCSFRTAMATTCPTAPAEVVLDGFHPPVQNHHNFANGLRFGPDGWLYGRCGAIGSRRCGRARAATAPHRGPGRHLALSSAAKDVRGDHVRHHESVGPRLERARRAFLHQHGQRPSLACRRRRAFRRSAHARSESARLCADRSTRRPLALRHGTGLEPSRATASPTTSAAATRTAAR